MKLNINKLQSGGGLPPFVQYTPVTVNNATPTTAKTEDDSTARKKEGLEDKDLLSLLKDIDGLPNDMQYVAKLLEKFYIISDGNPDPALLASQYTKVLLQIKIANFNKKEFDKAYEQVVKNNGLNEYAITDTGMLIAVSEDSDTPQKITTNEYMENPEKYQLLTNSNLLSLRANDMNYIMQNGLLGVAENGIGLEKVNQLIHNYLGSIGTNTLELSGFARTQSEQVINGIQYIQELASKGIDVSRITDNDGLHKIGIENKDQVSQAKLALNYIYNMLPLNAKTLLKVKTGSEEGAMGMIANFITSGISSTHKVTDDIVKDPNEDSNKDGKGAPPRNFVQNVQIGSGATDTLFTLNKGSQAEMSVKGKYYMAITKDNGDVIEDTTVSSMLSESGLQKIIDKTSVSFGNQIIRPEDLNKLVYRNSGGMRVVLPFTKDANGKIKPDDTILDRYKDVIDRVNARCSENTPDSERARIEGEELRKEGLNQYVNADGTPDFSKFQAFFVTNAYAYSGATEISDDNDMVEEVPDDDEKTYQYIDDVFNKNKTKGETKFELDRKNFYDLFWYDKVYSGTIYAPIISNNRLQALTGSASVNETQAQLMESEYQRWLKQTTMQNTSSNVL